MPWWRIRIAVPDSPASRSAVKQALSAQSVSFLRLAPSEEASSSSSEIVIELPQDDGITNVLSALHAISPQVFVSRADANGAASDHSDRVPEPTPRGNG